MLIAGAASALPRHKYDQTILLDALKRFWGSKLENSQFMQRLHQRVGVETRHLALPLEQYDGITLWGFDFIDLGRIRMPSLTVPVTIKSLVFSEDPRSHGKTDPSEWHRHGDGALHKHGHSHGHVVDHRHEQQ